MENYIDDITTVEEFKNDNPTFAKQADRAKAYLQEHYCGADEDDFVVIEVEGYNCVAVLLDDTVPYRLGEVIAPFDKEKIYPRQILITKYGFKRY